MIDETKSKIVFNHIRSKKLTILIQLINSDNNNGYC